MSASAPARLLVADDSATIRMILSSTLIEAGYEVVLASDGMDALDRLAEAPFALALLDVKMPRLDGFEVCRVLREERGDRKTKVIYLTSLGSEADKEWGISQGADAYLVKPVEAENLLTTIGNLLGNAER